MKAWRGTTLIMEKSHLYQRGKVLRHPLTLNTVASLPSLKAAKRYCEQNGFSYMNPVRNMDVEAIEQPI